MYYLLLVKLNGIEYHPLVWVYYPIHCPIRYSKYCSLIAVRYISRVPENAPSQKGSKQSVRSFRFTGVQLHSFTHCLHLLAGSQGGLCESGASSNASTVSCSRSRSGRRKAREQSSCHTLRFVHLPVSASGPIVAVSTLFAEAAKKSASRCKLVVKKKVPSAGVAT